MRKLFDKKNLIKYIKKLMPLIGIFLLIYLVIDIGTYDILSTFLKFSPLYIIIAASLTIPRVLIRNVQWQLILKKQKIFISYIKSLKIFLIGYFYGSITPGYAGMLLRVPYLKEETGEPVGKLFINCFVASAINSLTLYFMMIIGALLIVDKYPGALLFACVALLVTVLIYIFFIKKERGEKTFHFLIKLLIPKMGRHHFLRFVNTFYTDFPSIKDFILPFLLGIPSWVIMYTQIYILALSFNIEMPYLVFIMLYPIANIISFIPITSGGLGTREATLIFLFSFYGVASEITVVISLAGYLLTDVLTGFYGFIISVAEARNNKSDRSKLESLLKTSK